MAHRWSAALGVVLFAFLTTACGDGSATSATSTSGPSSVPASTTAAPPVTAATTVRPTTAPPTAPPTTAARSASLGETFSAPLGQPVSLTAAGLTVTLSKVLSDSRCSPGTQCIWEGEASVVVEVTKPGTPPGSLNLKTSTPKSLRYGRYTVELVRLGRGSAPVAGLKVR